MDYSLVIPEELVKRMYLQREQTGVSIRKQILQAIETHLADTEKQSRRFYEVDFLNERGDENVV